MPVYQTFHVSISIIYLYDIQPHDIQPHDNNNISPLSHVGRGEPFFKFVKSIWQILGLTTDERTSKIASKKSGFFFLFRIRRRILLVLMCSLRPVRISQSAGCKNYQMSSNGWPKVQIIGCWCCWREALTCWVLVYLFYSTDGRVFVCCCCCCYFNYTPSMKSVMGINPVGLKKGVSQYFLHFTLSDWVGRSWALLVIWRKKKKEK